MHIKDMKTIVNPKGWRHTIARWLLSKDHIHVFNAHVVQNEDGTVTIIGLAKKGME